MVLLVLLKKTLQFLTFLAMVILSSGREGIKGRTQQSEIRLLNKLLQEQLRHKDRKYLLP